MSFLDFRIKEYDQKTPVLIDSEDTGVIVMCKYAASIINGKLAIRCKLPYKGPLLKNVKNKGTGFKS